MPLTCTSTASGSCYCCWQVRPQPTSAPASGCPVLTIFTLFTAEVPGRRRELLHTEVVRECLPLLLSSLCLWDLFRLHMEFPCSWVFQDQRPGLRIVMSVTQDLVAWVNQKSAGLLQQGRFPEGGGKIEDQRQGQRTPESIKGEEALDLKPTHFWACLLLAGSEPHGSS